MLLLCLNLILAFYDPVEVNVIEIEHSKCTSNTICISTHKTGYQSLQLTFFPLIKCLINEPHPSAWGLKDYWFKSMQCQVLLVNNMPHDSILRTLLIALYTPLTSSINGLSTWFMETDWLQGLLQASTFMHQHDSSISGHKLPLTWPNAKNMCVVCLPAN